MILGISILSRIYPLETRRPLWPWFPLVLGIIGTTAGVLALRHILPLKKNVAISLTALSGIAALLALLGLKSSPGLFAAFDNKRLNSNIHGVYVLSNEAQIDATVTAMRGDPAKGRCHMGVGALHNFDLICARGSEMAVLFDFNPNNQSFIQVVLTLLKQTKNRQAFVDALCPYLDKNPQLYNQYQGYDTPSKRLRAELNRAESWLFEDARFEHIQRLAQADRIIPLRMDFSHSWSFRKLAARIQSMGYTIDSLYLSNVYAYMPADKFHRTFEALTASHPLVIHCVPPKDCPCTGGCQCPKVQQVSRNWTQGGLFTIQPE